MTDIVRSILMGLGCLSILGLVGCGIMGAGVIVAADRAADHAYEQSDGGDSRDAKKSPWDK